MTATSRLSDRLNEFENYIERELSGNEIAERMGLKMYQVEKLRTMYMDKYSVYIRLTMSGGRGILKASESGISIARGRLSALGLNNFFPKDQAVQLRAENGNLIISPMDSPQVHTETDDVTVASDSPTPPIHISNNEINTQQGGPTAGISTVRQ